MPEPYPDLEHKLRPLTDLLSAPRPGDWLAAHPEPGQTFAEYLNAQPVRRSEKLRTIYLCLILDFGEAQQRILDLTQDYLAVFFDYPVKINQQIALSSIPAKARRSIRPGAIRSC
jgi:archaemetzincin